MFAVFVGLIFFVSMSCGIKSKPLPPLKTTSQETDSENQKKK